MAARHNKRHSDDVRMRIQVSQLINVLENHAINGGNMENSRIKAIEVLLRKALPDLSSVTIKGDEDNPLQHSLKVEFIGHK